MKSGQPICSKASTEVVGDGRATRLKDLVEKERQHTEAMRDEYDKRHAAAMDRLKAVHDDERAAAVRVAATTEAAKSHERIAELERAGATTQSV